jgi:lipopolysaccharide/colanic/teichoic acid biosynthesis glycosyltransferase
MIKRLFDILLSLIALLLLLPVLFFCAIILFCLNCRPVLFTQPRPGYNNKIFQICKFRSMNDNKDTKGYLLPDSERLTPFGKMIRNTSIDELPSLWNVLKGDLSLVGPRPLLVEYLPIYSSEQSRRHEVKPGITGWAQINGRNAISWEEKFALDVWYVDNQSFWLDIKILYLTVKKVFSQSDINADGEATMTKFTGNNK